MSNTTPIKPATTNQAQQRVLTILRVLAGRTTDGMTNAQLARAVKTSESRMHGDIRNCEQSGFVERLTSGNWRLGSSFVQIANAHVSELAALRQAVVELEQRCGVLPR